MQAVNNLHYIKLKYDHINNKKYSSIDNGSYREGSTLYYSNTVPIDKSLVLIESTLTLDNPDPNLNELFIRLPRDNYGKTFCIKNNPLSSETHYNYSGGLNCDITLVEGGCWDVYSSYNDITDQYINFKEQSYTIKLIFQKPILSNHFNRIFYEKFNSVDQLKETYDKSLDEHIINFERLREFINTLDTNILNEYVCYDKQKKKIINKLDSFLFNAGFTRSVAMDYCTKLYNQINDTNHNWR